MNTLAGPSTIKLPDGRKASFHEMQRYGQVLQEFIREQEENLAQITNDRRHNGIIEYLQTLADGYNKQLGLYQSAEVQRRQKQLVAMILFVNG